MPGWAAGVIRNRRHCDILLRHVRRNNAETTRATHHELPCHACHHRTCHTNAIRHVASTCLTVSRRFDPLTLLSQRFVLYFSPLCEEAPPAHKPCSHPPHTRCARSRPAGNQYLIQVAAALEEVNVFADEPALRQKYELSYMHSHFRST